VISGGGVDELGRPPAPWFFKIAPAGSDYIKAVVEFAKSRGYKSIASLHATDAIGQADLKYLRQFSEAAGIKLAITESFALGDTNFNAQLVNIRNAKPDLLYNGATGNPAILVFKQIKQLELNMPMVLSQAAISTAFFTAVGGRDQVEGNYSVISIGALAAEVGGDTARLFGELSAALGKPAQLFHTFGWDTGILTEWALASSDATRQGIRDALEKAREIPAINGPLTFTPQDHIGQDTRGLVMAQFKDGKWRKVT
jgi:branched-chain amino acid transport system substrate-binding protein